MSYLYRRSAAERLHSRELSQCNVLNNNDLHKDIKVMTKDLVSMLRMIMTGSVIYHIPPPLDETHKERKDMHKNKKCTYI